MSSAEFVRNPDVNTAVYRWEATGIDELTRQNKLTSLPFWIPNATTRRHQFKLVLLRGLVPSADPSNDAFGLLVELIPPPSSPGAAAAAASSSQPAPDDVPGGCAVTCEVLPLDALDGRSTPPGAATTTTTATTKQQQQQQQRRVPHEKVISSTKTAVVDADNAQISFPDLIPADIVTNARYVAGSPKSLTVQVTIETGISVPLHQVTTTAYSFFSSLSSSVSQLLGTTTHLVHEGRENLSAILTHAAATTAPQGATARANDARGDGGTSMGAATTPTHAAAGGGGGGAALTPSTVLPPPWDQPPEEWRSRPEAWRSLLCERLAAFDGTYRHGVEKTLSTDEVALLMEVGLSESDLWSLYARFNFDRDVQENLLSAAVLRARRYALVPAKIKEETFWANFFWKVHCVGQCVTERQVSAVIAALCTPARAIDTDLSATTEEVLRVMADATEINAVLGDFVQRREAGESWCTVVAESARHCVAVLQVSASQRTDLAAHTRQQLQKALRELKATLAQYGTALSTPPSTPGVASAEASTAAVSTVEFEVQATPAAATAADRTAAVDADAATPPLAGPPTGGAAATTSSTTTAALVSPSAHEAAAPDTSEKDTAAETTTATADEAIENVDASVETAGSAALTSPRATAPAVAPAAASPPTRSEAARSTSRIEFAKMPWEEEDG